MDLSIIAYALVNLLGVFISAVSQVLLKKSALRKHGSVAGEYLNPLVIFAYVMFVGSTLLSVVSYRGIPLSMGPILDATGYLWVTFFGVTIFKGRLGRKKLAALALILVGIGVYSMSV